MEQRNIEVIRWKKRGPESVSDFIRRNSPIILGLAFALKQSEAAGNFDPFRRFCDNHNRRILTIFDIFKDIYDEPMGHLFAEELEGARHEAVKGTE